ncbi:MAG: sigma-70 family RNA polymerase sigma factor [Tepidisphaeraceae bacterium]
MIEPERVRHLLTIVQTNTPGPAVDAAVAELVSGFTAYVIAPHVKRRQVERDELLQIAALSIWQAAKRFDPARGVSSFGTFAYTVTARKVIDHYRRRSHQDGRRAGVACYSLDSQIGEASKAPTAIDCLIADELESVLTDGERDVLDGRLCGLSHRQIARRQRRTAASVDNALQRMRRKARSLAA